MVPMTQSKTREQRGGTIKKDPELIKKERIETQIRVRTARKERLKEQKELERELDNYDNKTDVIEVLNKEKLD